MAFQSLLRCILHNPGSSYQELACHFSRPAHRLLHPRMSVHTCLHHHLSKITPDGKYFQSNCFQNKHLQVSISSSSISLTTKHLCPVHLMKKHMKGFSLQYCVVTSLENSPYARKFSTTACKSIEQDRMQEKTLKASMFNFLNLKSFLSTPFPFMLYGISGLIPFTSVPIYMIMTSSYCSYLAYLQLVYGACILSFLGGVAWGNNLTTAQHATLKSLGYSVFLPLVGWLGVLMYPNITAFPIVITGIVFAGYIDTQILAYTQWFKNLRFLLTSLVTISMFSTFLLSFRNKPESKHS